MSAEDHLPPGDWEPDDCIHGLGPKSACVICGGKETDQRPHEERMQPRTFGAKFPGHCDGCNLPIAPGQLITWRPGEKARHAGC